MRRKSVTTAVRAATPVAALVVAAVGGFGAVPAFGAAAADPGAASAVPRSASGEITVSTPWSERFKLVAATGDGNLSWLPGGMVGMASPDDAAVTQRWDGADTVAKGGKTLTLHGHPGQCLDLGSDPYTDGALLLLRRCDQSHRQSWVVAFDPVRPNTARIINYTSKMAVTVMGSGTKAVSVVQRPYRPGAVEQTFYTDNCGLPGMPLFEVPHRRFALLSGPLDAARAFFADKQPPAYVWPADRRWCFTSDVDPHWAGIGAPRAAIDVLTVAATFDVVPADRADTQPFYH